MLTQLLVLFLGSFLVIAGTIAAIGFRRLVIGIIALPFATAAAAVTALALWLAYGT
jgi:hypothetical protein